MLEQSYHLTHLLVCLYVGLFVYQWVICGKVDDWIWMPFGMVNGVSQGTGVLDGVEIVEEEGKF